jgi:glycosyltransferase involved in cell wall biosynthesis
MSLSRVVVINDFSLKRGGATALALLSARLLRAAGVPVTYLSGDAGDDGVLAAQDVEHVALGGVPFATHPRPRALAQGLWNHAAEFQIARWVEQHDDPYTVYHLHGWHSILSPAVFAALRPVAARLVVHAHDFFLVCPNGAFMNFPAHEVCGLTPLSAACALSQCDRRSYSHKLVRVVRQLVQDRAARRGSPGTGFDVLLIHHGMRPLFARSGWPAERLFTLPNPCQPFSSQPLAAAAHRAFFFVGRLDPEKGAYDFAAASSTAGVPAVIVGEGPERAAIARDFPAVELTGWRTHEQIGDLMQRARCLVMPSRYPEPFGMVAVEALASGLPVIASSHSFLAQDIARLGLGLSLDTRDTARFAGALRSLAADDAQVAAMSERALWHVGELCTTVDAWRAGLIAHFERMLERARS